jgi:hypothetical protein
MRPAPAMCSSTPANASFAHLESLQAARLRHWRSETPATKRLTAVVPEAESTLGTPRYWPRESHSASHAVGLEGSSTLSALPCPLGLQERTVKRSGSAVLPTMRGIRARKCRVEDESVDGGRRWIRTSGVLHVKRFRVSAVLGVWESERNHRSYVVTVAPVALGPADRASQFRASSTSACLARVLRVM